MLSATAFESGSMSVMLQRRQGLVCKTFAPAHHYRDLGSNHKSQPLRWLSYISILIFMTSSVKNVSSLVHEHSGRLNSSRLLRFFSLQIDLNPEEIEAIEENKGLWRRVSARLSQFHLQDSIRQVFNAYYFTEHVGY